MIADFSDGGYTNPDRWANRVISVQVQTTGLITPGDICVHCALLNEGVIHDHVVLAVCQRGQPHKAWFNCVQLEYALLEGGTDANNLLDWSFKIDQRNRIIARLVVHDQTYAWYLQYDAPECRAGFVLGVWVD